jgi:hypothetical protein
MKPYAETEMRPEFIEAWKTATWLFDQIPDDTDAYLLLDAAKKLVDPHLPHGRTPGLAERKEKLREEAYKKLLRCHEVARAIAEVMGLSANVQDGWCGHAEHTWIWLFPNGAPPGQHMPYGTAILDVYAVGQLPPVQLIALDRAVGLHSAGGDVASHYRESRSRTDIRTDVVERLIARLRFPPGV